MSRLNSAIETAIFNWIDGATSTAVTTIWDKQSRNRPSLPYITLNISTGPILEGTPHLAYDDTDDYNHQFKKKFTLSVNSYAANNHLGLIEDIGNSMYFESNKVNFRAANLQVRSQSDIRELSELLDTKYEFRAGIDFFCSYGEDVSETIGYINQVTYSGTLTNEISGTVTISAIATGS